MIFIKKNPGQVVSKLNFCSIFREAWLKAVTPDNICAGFRKAVFFHITLAQFHFLGILEGPSPSQGELPGVRLSPSQEELPGTRLSPSQA